jgi:hypothetical protein
VLASALKSGGGNGDGGSTTGGAVSGQLASLSAAVSEAPGALTNGPISTTGEKLSIEFEPLPTELGDPPSDDFATANLAEEMSQEPTQGMDALVFAGLYSPNIIGGTGEPAGELPFSLSFSITSGEGIANFAFPNTGDQGLFLETNPEGVDFISDTFLVETQNGSLVNAQGLLTFLGGSPDAAFTINSDNVLNGVFSVNYVNSPLIQGIVGLEGTIAAFNGIQIDGTDLPFAIDAIRDFLTSSQ